MTLKTLPNANPKLLTKIALTAPMPSMCPRSGNPQAGSLIMIVYAPGSCVLEVYSLAGYLQQYVGGRQMANDVLIRDMEQTIQQIALDCREALGVDVTVIGELMLQQGQRMTVEVAV